MPHFTLGSRFVSKARTRARLAVEALEARDVPAVYTWLPTDPGAYSWNDPANWNGNEPSGFPNAADDVANLVAPIRGNQVINLSTAITVAALNVGSSGTATGAFTITGNGNTLTFQNSSGAAALTALPASDGDAILARVVFASPVTITNNATAPLSVFDTVIASSVLTVAGTGPVAFPDGAVIPPGTTLAGSGRITTPTVLFATSFFDSALYAFDAATGDTLATLAAPYVANTLLISPAGLTVGPDGDLYISNQANTGNPNESILKYDLDTFTLSTFITTTQLNEARAGTGNNNPVFAPAGLTFGPDGDLYIVLNGGQNATSPGSVIKFDIAAGAYAGTFTQVVGGLSQASRVTFGTGGEATSLFVTSSDPIIVMGQVVGFNGRVTRVANAATAPTAATFVTPGSGNLSFASGLTFGPDGNLYVADLAALEEVVPAPQGRIVRFDANGMNPTNFTPPSGNPGSLSLQFPSGIVFNDAGDLLVANLGPTRPPATNGSIFRFKGTGTFDGALVTSAQFPNTGMFPGGPQTSGVTPSEIKLVTAGDLFVGGTVVPGGPTPGRLTVPDVRFAGGSTLVVQLNGTTVGTQYDQFASTGTVSLNNVVLALTTGFTAPIGSQFTIVSSAAPIVGTFNGLAEGAAITVGTQQFTITYTGGPSGNDVVLTAVPVPTPPTITGPAQTTFNIAVGVPFTITVTATGFPAPTFSVTSGVLPNGLTINSTTGVISGTPTMPGLFTSNITASNSQGTDSRTFTFNVTAPVAPMITSANATTFTVGSAGTFTVTATGNPTPTVSAAGALPTGVTFNTTTGVLSGTPAAGTGGVYALTTTASNNVPPDAMQNFTLTVNEAPAITSGNATTFDLNMASSFQVTTTGFPVPTFIQTGTLPTGVTFSPSGLLSGTPTQSGDFPITITASSAAGTVSQVFTLTVTTPPAITSADTVTFTVGSPANFQVTTTGNPTPTLGLTGTLPADLTFNLATGVISGTPAAGTGGNYTVGISATNSAGTTNQVLTITVLQPPAITSATNATFDLNVPNSFQVTATGFPAPTFSQTGTLPNGVTFDASGLLSGTPTQSGTFPITITATSTAGTQSQVFALTVGTPPVFTSAGSATFTRNTPGNFQVTATGFPAPTFTTTSPLPDGVTLSPTGLLSGTATTTGEFPITITATSLSGTTTQNFTLTIGALPAITSPSSAAFTAGAAANFQVTTTGFPVPTLTQTGTLPPGVTFDTATGTFSGTPTRAGTFPVTVTATNTLGFVTQTINLTVTGGGLVVTPATLPAPVLNTAYSRQLAATGGTGPYTFGVVSGRLPTGLTLSTSGLLSGTPTEAGTFTFTVRATDTASPSTGIATYPLTVRTTPTPGTPPKPSPRLTVSGPTDGTVTLFDPSNGMYPSNPTGTLSLFAGRGVNVRTIAADVNGDATPDVVMVTGPGAPVRFAVVSGTDNTTVLVPESDPFGGNFTGGGFVAAGDLDGDGRSEFVFTPDQGGGPNVVIYSLGADGQLTAPRAFFALGNPEFRGGARPAMGDINGDGTPDLAVGAGFLGGPNVEIHDGAAVANGDFATLIGGGFFAFDGPDAVTLRNGVFLAAGDVNGDGFADLISGGGPGGGARVLILDGKLLSTVSVTAAYTTPLANFFFGDDSSRGGVRVAAVDVDGDTRIDVAVGSGEGQPSRVRVYFGNTIVLGGEPSGSQDLDPFGQFLPGGVFVG